MAFAYGLGDPVQFFIDLSGNKPLAAGTVNLVFAHPDDPRLLVKVIRPEALIERWGAEGPWRKKLDRAGQNVAFIRELAEYCVLRARFSDEKLPIERPVALVDTNFGLGLVVEAIRRPDGGLAPTIAQLVEQRGLTPVLRRKLHEFHEELQRFDTVVSAIAADNLVVDQGGDGRIVLIDGIGEKAAIPVNYWFRWVRRRSTRRRFNRMMKMLERLGTDRAEALARAGEAQTVQSCSEA